jgi:probable phosphoglycerate mutase
MPTPRVIFIRHGQTEWSKSGQFTSVTDLDLTPAGVEQMRKTGIELFQRTQFLKAENIKYIFTSPRKRALETIDRILETLTDEERSKIRIVVDNDLREWEYGDYEGLLNSEIVKLRASRGLDKERPWLIWRDGCDKGESTKEVGARLSRAIKRIQNVQKQSVIDGKANDVLVFAHGHTLRYFAALWFRTGVEAPIEEAPAYVKSFTDETVDVVEPDVYRYLNSNPNFVLDAGGIGALTYAHCNFNEPALSLSGGSSIQPADED